MNAGLQPSEVLEWVKALGLPTVFAIGLLWALLRTLPAVSREIATAVVREGQTTRATMQVHAENQREAIRDLAAEVRARS